MLRAPGFGPGLEVTLTPLAVYHLLPRLYRVAVKQVAPVSRLLRHRPSPAATKKVLDRHPVRTQL
jgi:hypothetical protein